MDAFSAYIPIDRRQAVAENRSLPERGYGAVLVADISGFTPLTESLTQELGPNRGAEELTVILNEVYGGLVTAVHAYSGSVIGFAGDAIVCWFMGDEGRRALTCGFGLQKVMANVRASRGDDQVPLTLKVAAVTGRVRRFIVGDPDIQRMDIIVGQTLVYMDMAERQAQRGEVVVSEEIIKYLGDDVVVAEWREAMADDESQMLRWAVVGELKTPAPETPWVDVPTLPEEVAQRWVLPAVYRRLQTGRGQFLGELRPVAVMFMKFDGIEYETDADADRKLDQYIRWVQNVIGQYDGSMLQVIVGDKGSYCYATFGAPVAHDDDAIRAAAAALDLQQLPPELSFIKNIQIGVTWGPTRSGAYGSDVRRTYGVLGDKVNLAARLMDAADPGTVFCDYDLYHAARSAWTFEALPPVRVKGKAGLIRVYQPVKQVVERPLSARHDVMVGRQIEYAHLGEALDNVKLGQSAVVFLIGETGIGKSRLVTEFNRLVPEKGVAGLLGAGQSIEQQKPYRAWRDIMNSYFDIEEIGSVDERRDRVVRWVQEVAPEQMQRLPLLNDILNLGIEENTLTGQLTPDLRQQSLVLLVIALMRAWASERPLVLVLEDAHWFDTLSWDLSVQVARSLQASEHPLLMLVVARPISESNPGFKFANMLLELEHCRSITLDNLAAREIVSLIATQLETDEEGLPDELVTLVQKRAGGNPLFAKELVISLREEGVIQRLVMLVDGKMTTRYRVQGSLEEMGQVVPSTLRGLILARIDRLPPEKQLLLKVAAVIGRTFMYTPLQYALAQFMPTQPDELRRRLDELVSQDLLYLETLEPDDTYVFKHIITQEVAYETMLFAQRQYLHLILAEWYQQQYANSEVAEGEIDYQLAPYYSLLVYHYRQAEDKDKERYYSRLAGDLASEQFAHAEAISYYNRALNLMPYTDLSGCYDLVLAREKINDLRSARDEQWQDIEVLRDLADALNDDGKRLEVMLEDAAHGEATGRFDEVMQVAEKIIGLAKKLKDRKGEGWGYLRWGGVSWRQSKMDEAREYLDAALELMAEWPALRASVLRNLGIVAAISGDLELARAKFTQALEASESVNDRYGMASTLNNLGNVSMFTGDYSEALISYEKALSINRSIGARRQEGNALGNLGESLRTVGAYSQALTYYVQAVRASKEAGNRQGLAAVYASLGQISYYLDDYEQAVEYSHNAIEIAEELGHRQSHAQALSNLGRTEAIQSNWTQALDYFEQALTMRVEADRPGLQMETRADMAAALWHVEKLDRAKEEVDQVLDFLDNKGGQGIEAVGAVYLHCYQVLEALEDSRAEQVLLQARSWLEEQASKITDQNIRYAFLNNIQAHRQLRQIRRVAV
ncbi:MAG TPA: tetratricopeptide repeat protein [Anaerolineae bacterium]|nr:tetratricopeptide repeat protein [Anaerolineae bacterium]